MKTIPAGRLKRITYNAKAVEDNKPRVRRREPVFVIEVEEGENYITEKAYAFQVEGSVESYYHVSTGLIRFETEGVIHIDDIGDATDAAKLVAAPTQPKAKKSTR